MGYFSNGTEGMSYEEEFCNRCVNVEISGVCPILDLHMRWNYDQHGDAEIDKAKKQALDLFIPRDANGNNEKCRFFVLRTEPLIK